MEQSVNVQNVGLRGVTVADTKISFIDGEKGVLLYRGYRIEQLAKDSYFMEVAYLILNGRLPNKSELMEFDAFVKDERELPGYVYETLNRYPKNAAPMDVLQSAVISLAMSDPDLLEETRDANIIEEKFAETQDKPALYRPKAEYVGQYCGLSGCTYEPLESRVN